MKETGKNIAGARMEEDGGKPAGTAGAAGTVSGGFFERHKDETGRTASGTA